MLAFLVATPVLDRLAPPGLNGVVSGVVGTVAYIEADGLVVALTARGVPLMPNGIALTGRPGPTEWPPHATPVRLMRGRLEAGARSVAWPTDPPPAWDPTLRVVPGTTLEALRARGAAILTARGIGAEPRAPALAQAIAANGLEIASHSAGRNGIALLLSSVAGRDAELAGRAAELLVGRGPGLTPEGDDLIAGAAAVVAACGAAAGWDPSERGRWLASVRAPNLHRLTTPLSATLLELATAAQVVEPLHGLLDFSDAGASRWSGALRRLERIGHSTGPSYAAGIGAAAVLAGG
jgi:Protein of unknown function (DUF2877)